MKFIDEAEIDVAAGDGGPGAVSFRREAHVPFGGPNGGDGARGGSVVLTADEQVGTLLQFRFKPRWQAEHGEKGGRTDCNGKSGEDLRLKVPVGTVVSMNDLPPTVSRRVYVVALLNARRTA